MEGIGLVAEQTLHIMILVLSFSLLVGMFLLGIGLFWRLRSMGKPMMASFFWVVAFGFVLIQFWRPIAYAYKDPGFVSVLLGVICVMVISAYVAAWFYNPWPPQMIDKDESDEA